MQPRDARRLRLRRDTTMGSRITRAGNQIVQSVRSHPHGLSKRRRYVPVAGYFLLGCGVYRYLEGWAILDSIYFMLVTSTTVGYGDFAPVTEAGRLFTSAWALIGITLVFSAIQPLAEYVLRLRVQLEKRMVDVLPFLREAELPESPDSNLEEYNAKINYPRRYIMAMSGPILLLLVMLAAGPFLIGLSVIDSIYFAVISMATIGYGDIVPSNSLFAQIFAICFLPLAVTSLAQALSEIALITRRRTILETDLKARQLGSAATETGAAERAHAGEADGRTE